MDSSKQASSGSQPVAPDKDGSDSPSRKSAESPSVSNGDEGWSDPEIDAAMSVLEALSKSPGAPPSSVPSTAADEGDRPARPRELSASALSASSVEKSKRSGAPPSSRRGSAQDTEQAPRSAEVKPALSGTAASQAEPRGSARDESEEQTHYYDRSRLAPQKSAGNQRSELDEPTNFYDRAAVLRAAGMLTRPAQVSGRALDQKGGTNRQRESQSSGSTPSERHIAPPERPQPPTTGENEEPTLFYERPAHVTAARQRARAELERSSADAASAAPLSSRVGPHAPAQATPESPAPASEAPRSAPPPSGSPPSRTSHPASLQSALVVAPPSSADHVTAAAAPQWTPERQSSLSLGIGIGVLSTDAPRPGSLPQPVNAPSSRDGLGSHVQPIPPLASSIAGLPPLGGTGERSSPVGASEPASTRPRVGALEAPPATLPPSPSAELHGSDAPVAKNRVGTEAKSSVAELGEPSSKRVAPVASALVVDVRDASLSASVGEPPSRRSPRAPIAMPTPATVSSAALAGVEGRWVADAPPSVHSPASPLEPRVAQAESISTGSSGIIESPTSESEPPISERFNDLPAGAFDLPAPGNLTAVTTLTFAPRPGAAALEEQARLDRFGSRALRRFIEGAACSVGCALLLAPLDAWFASRVAADRPANLLSVLTCAGLMAPVALLIGCAASVLSLVLHPEAAPSVARFPDALRPPDARRRARLAVIVGLSPLAFSCWLILVTRAALPLLGSNAPPKLLGLLLAASSVGLGLILAAPVLAAARYLGVRLRRAPPDPTKWAVWGGAAGLMPLAFAVATGPTSGAGSALAAFGVFRRPELDLRAPAMLLAIFLAGYLLPNRLSKLPVWWLLTFLILPLGLTYLAGWSWLDTRAIALSVERGAPISRLSLPVGRRLTDGDHDGFARVFGGGDCNDGNARVNPGADDLPENGIDEDCSGADSVATKRASGAATSAEALRERRAGIPKDLNLILFIVDTMRADTLRHPKRVTPHIDELYERSVAVNNAYAPASYTGKSVGPLLIGKHSSETNRDYGHFSAFNKRDIFVQQRLKSAGIRTLSVQGYWYFHQPQYGFDRGFDVVDSEASTAAGYVEGDRSSTSEKLTDRILAQLEKAENTNGRFFLWSQYTDPHAEYIWHQGFDFGPQSIGKYFGEVAFVDHHIGRVLDFVRSKPWGARTAVVVTSDHGEAFGEHGMIRHGFELWEPLVRVPLVMYVPGIAPRQIASRRTLIDLVPTILDLMQVGIPAASGSDFVSGQSMLPEMLGIDGADQARPLLVDMAQGPYTSERQAYIEGDYKLIAAQGRPLGLFNLVSDPSEKQDLLDDVGLRERIVSAYRAYRQGMRVVEVKPKP
ncbi:MAG: sulfatase-like hydrolase/transferase [Myxococcales bacterium]